MRRSLAFFFVLVCVALASVQSQIPQQPKQGDFVLRDFHFRSGEVLPELRLHYATLGTPVRDAHGTVQNAVIILHGTTGSGKASLTPAFLALYAPGQPLDVSRWYVILPDSIGHGQSSRPSDGLRARFPRYDYYDMVEAQYRLVTERLGINHLRLVTGISMGGMHTWLWGELHPDFMDALMPMVSQPVEIAGRNRMWRRTAMDAIRKDPGWNNGEYQTPPTIMVTVARIFAMAVGADPGGGRQPAGSGFRRLGPRGRQRHAVTARLLSNLQPGTGPGTHPGTPDRPQCSRRLHQSARAGHYGSDD
jgi:homoserine O-acetyltransferase